MASRMEKYHDDEQNRTSSRLERNKQKYDDFKNMAYTEFPAVKEVTIPTKFIDKDEPFVLCFVSIDFFCKRFQFFEIADFI